MLFSMLVCSGLELNPVAASPKRKTVPRTKARPRVALGKESSLDQPSGELCSEPGLSCSSLFVPQFPNGKIKLTPALALRQGCGRDQRTLNLEKFIAQVQL